MGEPRPGDIVDNIFLSINQLQLADDQSLVKGDVIVPQGNTQYWEKADGAENLTNGVAIIRAPANTVGEDDGESTIEAMVAPSYTYGIMGGVVNPGHNVKLDGTGQKWVAATEADIGTGVIGGIYSQRAGETVASASADDVVGIIKMGVL